MLFVFIYIYWYPAGFPYQMMFVSFNNNTTGATAYSLKAPHFTRVRVS